MKHIKLFEQFVNEKNFPILGFGAAGSGDWTKKYDGFIILDIKNKKTWKARYIKGTRNVKAEDDAIAKVMQKTGEPRNAFMVHGFIKKGEWDNTNIETI